MSWCLFHIKKGFHQLSSKKGTKPSQREATQVPMRAAKGTAGQKTLISKSPSYCHVSGISARSCLLHRPTWRAQRKGNKLGILFPAASLQPTLGAGQRDLGLLYSRVSGSPGIWFLWARVTLHVSTIQLQLFSSDYLCHYRQTSMKSDTTSPSQKGK